MILARITPRVYRESVKSDTRNLKNEKLFNKKSEESVLSGNRGKRDRPKKKKSETTGCFGSKKKKKSCDEHCQVN